MEVDDATGFTEAFTHLHTGAPCRDKVGLLNVVLAEGLNLGLSKMAGATSTHDFMQLSRLSRWHVESDIGYGDRGAGTVADVAVLGCRSNGFQ